MNSEQHGTTESTEVTEKDIERREKDLSFCLRGLCVLVCASFGVDQ